MKPTPQPRHGSDTSEVFDLDGAASEGGRHAAPFARRDGTWVGRLVAVGSVVGACALVSAMALSGGDPDVAVTAVPAPSVSRPAMVSQDLSETPGRPSAPAASTPSFDPFSAVTPEVAQPDGTPSVMPLPTAPATIATARVADLGHVDADRLLTRPAVGRATSPFGMRLHPVLGYWKLHTGQDWAAACGTPVGAARAGTVVFTGWAGGNGVQVKIDHGMISGHRVVTTYNHLSAIGVAVGQEVDVLDGIGLVGSTGYSTGCHLHFEVIVDGQFTDPIPWLNGKPTVVDLSRAEYTTAPTASASPTATKTPDAASATPSKKPSSSRTRASSTAKPSASASQSRRHSPSPSAAPSPSPSPMPAESPSPSVSPSPSPSASPSPSPEGSESAGDVQSSSVPPTLEPTVKPTPSGE